MKEVADARALGLAPLRWRHVTHGRRRSRLRSPIEIVVDFRDGLWIHEYAPLGVLAYGESRQESLEAFRTDFAACWDSLAQEDDASLTGDARELKRRLVQLVQTVTSSPAHAPG